MLIIRLQSPDDLEPAWALLSGASAEWTHGAWETLLPLAQGQQVVLLIPSREVLLTQTTVNTRNQRQLQQAIPFVLEDAIAEVLEDQHIVWQVRAETTSVDVAIIDRNRLREWVATLQKQHIRPAAILPDVFALPWEAGSVTLWQFGSQNWLRCAELAGFFCANSALPLMLASLQTTPETPLRLRLYTDQPTAWVETNQFEIIPEIQPEQLFAHSLKTAMPLNLLRGLQDETKAHLRQQWQRWRLAAILAGCALVLGLGWFAVNTYQMQQQLTALNVENANLFSELFPDAGSVSEPGELKNRLQSALQGLGKQGGQTASSPLAALATFAEAFAASSGLTVEEIRTHAGSVSVDLQAQDQASVDKLRETLVAALGGAVELKSSSTADTLKATLTLGGKP
jgi:general secretion pathway protein L